MPTLEAHREQAKLLVRWHREGDYSLGGRARRLERYRSLTDCEVLELKFTLAMAQEIVAVEAGHRSWAALKAAVATAPKAARTPPGSPRLRKAIPILFVRNVETTAIFFRDKLGFAIDFLHGLPPFYGAVSRDGISLHLRFVYKPLFAEAAAREGGLILASIQVENVQGLFEEFKAHGVEFAQKLKKQAWGGSDLQVRDPDGNVISFATFDHL